MSKDRLFFYYPGGQADNTGDLIINKVAIDTLRKHGDVVIVDKYIPTWFLDEISYPHNQNTSSMTHGSIFLLILHQCIRNLRLSKNRKDIWIVYPPGHVSKTNTKDLINTLKNIVTCTLYKLAGAKIIRLGFSMGPLSKLNGFGERILNTRFTCYGLRDSGSLLLAKSHGLKNIDAFPDFSWGYLTPLRELEKQKAKYIVLSFRSNSHGTLHDEKYLINTIKKIRGILQALEFKKIVISYQVIYDRAASFQILEDLSKDHDVEIVDHKLLPKEAVELYSKAEVVITNRLHVLMLSALSGSLPLALTIKGDNDKIIKLLESNELSELNVDCSESTENNKAIEINIKNSKAIKEKILSVRERKSQEIYKKIASTIK